VQIRGTYLRNSLERNKLRDTIRDDNVRKAWPQPRMELLCVAFRNKSGPKPGCDLAHGKAK
jgi:hypothetical protein